MTAQGLRIVVFLDGADAENGHGAVRCVVADEGERIEVDLMDCAEGPVDRDVDAVVFHMEQSTFHDRKRAGRISSMKSTFRREMPDARFVEHGPDDFVLRPVRWRRAFAVLPSPRTV